MKMKSLKKGAIGVDKLRILKSGAILMKSISVLVSLLFLLFSCSSGVKPLILKKDYASAEKKLQEEGLTGAELYKRMATDCIRTWRKDQYPKAVEYYIKSGMEKEAAYSLVARTVVWAYEKEAKDYTNHASYYNYLSLVKRVNKARLSRSLQIRKLAMDAMKDYKNGKWPSAGKLVYPKYLKIIDLKIRNQIIKMKFAHAQQKKKQASVKSSSAT